ncbi:MAG TPA: hypothetical protein VNJ05_03160 [Sphingomicrobium sp.]|nr:hypothetical protein [Sphingomicrobium sp.]
MRRFAVLVPLALLAAPAAAAEPESRRDGELEVPAELTDPAMAGALGRMLADLTKAMLDVPVGEVQAAAEGREPTAADRRRTVRDLAGRDADFERKVEQQVALAIPRMQATMRAMAKSLPAMARAMEKAAEEMEGRLDRATANLPQPGYPRR